MREILLSLGEYEVTQASSATAMKITAPRTFVGICQVSSFSSCSYYLSGLIDRLQLLGILHGTDSGTEVDIHRALNSH